MRHLIRTAIFIQLLFCLSFDRLCAQESSLVHWLTFKEAFELNKVHPKPFIIDVYTGWCGWCKHMMKTTYSDPNLAQYVNTWFYPVKFDAETSDTIEYLNVRYVNHSKNPRSTHELALKLLGNRLEYPTTLFANFSNNFMLTTSGYLETNKMYPLLVYTVENIYKSAKFESFQAGFNRTFFEKDKDRPLKLVWKPIQKIDDVDTVNRHRKKIVLIYTDWCNGCKVMQKATFEDSLVLKHFKKEYVAFSFNAEEKDSLLFNHIWYKNDGKNGTPFNNLALQMTHNNLVLPTMVFLDENNNIIDLIPQYLSEDILNLVLTYYGEDIYKNLNWNDFYNQKTQNQTEKNKTK